MIGELFKRITPWIILFLVVSNSILYVLMKRYEIESLREAKLVISCTDKLNIQNSAILALHQIQEKKDLLIQKANEESKKNQKELTRLKTMKIPSDCNDAVKLGIKEGIALNQKNG